MLKRSAKQILVFLFILSILCSLFLPKAGAASAESRNTVLLIDMSGSMKGPDPRGNTLQFAQLLVDLHQNDEGKLGFIAFHEDIALALEPEQITDFNIASIKEKLSKLKHTKNTDLGLGLKAAVDMLDGASGQIILLSDGEVKLIKSNKTRSDKDNQADQTAALALCEKNSIPIHAFILDTSISSDWEASEALSSNTEGQAFLLDPKAPLLPQYLSAYADSQGLSLSKLSELRTTGEEQSVDVELPFIEYMQDLDYILFPSSRLESCHYNDAATARISIGDRYVSIHQASDTLSTQKISVSAKADTEIEIYSLKRINFIPVLNYDESTKELQGRLLDPISLETISGSTPLPLKVSVYKGDEVQDTLSLSKEGEVYRRAYSLNQPGNFQARASVSIDGKEIESKSISLPATPVGPVALSPDTLEYSKRQSIALNPGDFFEYAQKGDLQYKLLEHNLNGNIYAENGQLLIENPSLTDEGYILLEAADPYGQRASARIPIRITLPWAILIASILAGLLLLASILLFLFGWLRKKRAYFDGSFAGNFIATRHGKDLPEFICLKDVLRQKSSLTLQELFSLANVTESLPEARSIHFKAQSGGEVLFWHRTNCKILLESETVHRGQKFSLKYGNRLFIFFEDDSTELELQYLHANPSAGKVNSTFSIKMR